MAGRRVYRGGGGSGSDLTLLIHNQMDSFDNSLPLDSSFLSGSSSSSSSPSLLGPRSMVSFEDVPGRTGMKLPIFSRFDSNEENSLDDYDLDAYSHQPEKKRRLTANQVHFLEKSFEIDNKLEPESKTRLAKELGLQPRQVAIWFQNRRARYKTKQLEKDYDILQGSYNCLKTEYENLLKEKEKLKSELIVLKDKWGLKEKEIEKSEQGEYVISSGKGDDVFEYDSHHYHSDLSQNEEDTLIKGKARLFPSYVFPKIEDVDYSDPSTDSGNFGFESVAEDYSALWSWSYCGVV